MTKKFTSAFVFLFCNVIISMAQQGPVSSGSNASSSAGSVSYSIGQVDYLYFEGSNGSALQGLQQPFEISIVSGVEEQDIRLVVNIYPNPTSNRVYLSISEERDLNGLEYILYNIEGKVIGRELIVNTLTSISLEQHEPGTYILQIIKQNEQVKSFKIIKN